MVHTKTLSAGQSMALANQRIVDILIIVQSGSCNLTGNGKFLGNDSDAISLPTNSVVKLTEVGSQLESLNIAAVGGVTDVIVQY